MVLFSRQINLLCKYAVRKPSSFPVKIKLLETSKNKSHVCALFVVSSNHQYSTLQNGKTTEAGHILNRRLLAATIVSHHHLSTDNVVDKVQSVQGGRDFVSFVSTNTADGSAAKVSPGSVPVEHAVNATGLPASDHTETILSNGNVSGDIATTLTDTLPVLDSVEIPLSAVGLGGWSPVGLVQQFIQLLHVQLDLPWWAAIVAATFVARILLFPVLVKAQQNAVKMSNHMPQLQAIQQKFNKARRSGNSLDASKYGMEIQLFMKKHDMNPLKSALIPLIQAPVFISFFLGLRQMARLPVESLKTGGIGWITDLTLPDPYYITPVVTCATLYVVIKIGAESGIKLENMKLVRYVLTALPVIILPFTIHFPAAVLCYWCATNFFTLGAVSILKIERVRSALNIPKRKPIPAGLLSPKKGFVKSVKEAIEDQKMLNVVADRARIDEIRFQKAGTGPIPRTYSYDPTKPRPAAAATAAARKAHAKEYKP